MESHLQHATLGLASLIGAYQDPHALYDAARERDAISFDEASKAWVVTGHAPARAILSDARFSSELTPAGPRRPLPGRASFLLTAIQRQVLFTDDERHRRVQRIVLRESARTMHEMEPALRDLAARLLEPARTRGTIDLVRDFATPYTLEAISRMVGIPTTDARTMADLAQWSTTFANVTSGYLQVNLSEITQLGDYFRTLVTSARPAGLIATFLAERAFEDEDDLIANCMMVFSAGRVTTQKLLGDGVPLLFGEWEQWRAVVRDDASVVRRLTEELLRLVTPTRYLARRVVEDVDLTEFGAPGRIARRGEKVILFLEAANRDPQAFGAPHALRPAAQPNPQVAFGHGPHRCPGASIARLEVNVAIETLLATFATLRVHPTAPPVWDPNPNIGGYVSLPCLCG